METIIVTGLSGAGKTQTINILEDLGYYCIDNMPPSLIKEFMKLTVSEEKNIKKVAFGIDIRGGEFFKEINPSLNLLKNNGTNYKIIFLDASDEILIRRFNETRRKHPLAVNGQTAVGIKKERNLLKELQDEADFVINTSNIKVAKLNEVVRDIISTDEKEKFIINISSFGFKNGVPLEANIIFDVRFIPNPYYVESLKNYTGNNKKIMKYVMKYEESREFLDSTLKMIKKMIPLYMKQGKFHLNIAFGCTGGKHRSVVMANSFSKMFHHKNIEVRLNHRDCKTI